MREKKERRKRKMSAAETAEYIKKALGYKSYADPPKYWLDLGSPYANKVFGSKGLGIPYGKMILIAGPPSSGKTVIAANILGMAQADGADGGWADGENSWDELFVKRHGVNIEDIALFRPEYGTFGYKSKKKNRLIKENVEASEDVFTRVETWMKLRRKQNPKGKIAVVVDSTTSFVPEEEGMAGLDEQNMRTRTSSAMFWNTVTKHWISLAYHCNALIIFITQLRTNPGKRWGNPEYATGGNGLQYYSSIVVWMRRISDGAIMKNGHQIGVRGIISNRKNKAGGGSRERKRCGYKVYFRRTKMDFMDADILKKETKNARQET